MNAQKTHPHPSKFRRIAVIVAVVLTGWHLFATFLWIAPRSELRDVVPGNLLQEYMSPMFGQSWSVFAPSPISADYHFDVRAAVERNGTIEVTEWVRASDVELSRLTYNLFPPRSIKLGTKQARDYRADWQKLETSDQELAQLNYFKGDDWEERLADTMLSRTESSSKVSTFLEEDRRTTAYATQVALAVWGDDILRVQFKASRQGILPWSQRDEPGAERPTERSVSPGWRGLVIEEHQSQEIFAKYFCSAPMEVCITDDE